MIVRCPSCSSRREVPIPETARGGTLVDCSDCGHGWIEGMAFPVMPDLRSPVPAPITTEDNGRAAQLILEATREARKEFGKIRQTRRKMLAAWGVLLILAMVPPVSALAFPERVVATVPASIRLYDMLGREVNIYGLEIRGVDVQHLLVDGRSVIAIKGELANVSRTIRKIPWLRFGLRSSDGTEVYRWTLDTEVRPLKSGESTSFVTRLASPPEAARNLEIRFARADEIGSNADP